MTDRELHDCLDGLADVQAWARCDALGEVIRRGGPGDARFAGAAPVLLHQATEIGRAMGLGTLRDLELHGEVHVMCLPSDDGALLVEAGSRGALTPVTRLLAMAA